jgi:hypothetical protein
MRQTRHAPQALLNVLLAILLVATSLLPLAATAEARDFARSLADVAAEIGNPGGGIYVKYSITGFNVTHTNKPHDFIGEPTGDAVRATGLIRISIPGTGYTKASMSVTGGTDSTEIPKQSWPPAGDNGLVGSGEPRRTVELPFDMAIPVKAGEAGWIQIRGCMLGGIAECETVRASFQAPGKPGATTTSPATPTLVPAGGTELRAIAKPLFLPPDGKAQSTVVFTWLENGKPVAGKNITLGWNGDGTLDRPSGVTDANGQVFATYTAPKSAGTASQQIEVVGRGEGVAEAKALIQVGVVGVTEVSSASRADLGGDQILIDAEIANYHSAAIANVPVEFWDGDPAAGGKLLGTKTIATIPAGGKAWSCGSGWRQCVNWPIGGNATKRTLTVRVPQVAGLGGNANSPLAARAFTVSNYGAPFKTNVDGYNFENYSRNPNTTEFLEDALAIQVVNEKLNEGLRVLSYPSLLQDFAETYGTLGGAHCLGMATSSIAYFRDSSLKPAPGPTYGYSKNDQKVKAQIGLYHVYQMSNSFKKALPLSGNTLSTDNLAMLRDYAAGKLGAGQPIAIGMGGPRGGHAVVAYQMTEIEEYGVDKLAYYDSNYPWQSLTDGIAWQGRMWPASGSFAYEDFRTVTVDSDIKMPANAGAVFADLAKSFAKQMMSELTGGLGQLRLITFRGPAEPVLVTPDGKRLGYLNGQPVADIPGGKIAKLLDSYVFVVPVALNVRLTAKASADGTVTAGAATPSGGSASSPRFPGFALPDPRALFAPATAATVLFDKVPVRAGDAIEIQFTGDQAILATGGKPVQPTSRATVDAATLGATPPATAPATPTAAPAAQPAPAATGPSASPTFRDPLEGKSDPGASGFSGPQNTNVGATRGVAWVPGKEGLSASLTGMDSFVGYAGARLKADQGSIVVRFKPAPDLAGTFAKRDPSWKDSGQNKPPQSGFLLDTIGWNGAPKGSWYVTLDPSAKGGLAFGIWDGGKWHAIGWGVPAGWTWDANRWYDIGVTWGPKGMTILVDGEQKAVLPDVVSVSNTIPWFLGQAPWYWPYGPHSILGAFDDVRVYGEQIGPYASVGAPPPAASAPPTAATTGGTPAKPGGTASVAAVPGTQPPVTKPVFGGAGTVVQWPLGSPPNMVGGAPPPAGSETGKPRAGGPSPSNGVALPTPGAAGAANGSSNGAATGAANGAANGVADPLSDFSVGGPAAITLGKAVGVPNGDVTSYLPGGQSGLVAGAIDKVPGGTPLICGLPFLFGGGLLVLLLGAIGVAARPWKKRKKSPVAGPQPPSAAQYVPPPPAPPPTAAPASPVPALASTIYCDQCGKSLSAGMSYCDGCGAKVETP